MLRFCKSYLYKSFYKNGACLIAPKTENEEIFITRSTFIYIYS